MVSKRPFLLVLLGCVFASAGTAQSVQPPSEQGQGPDAASETPAPEPATAVLPATRGDILMARKQYRDAIDSYDQAIKDVAVVYNKIGIAYHQLMDFKAALQYYQRALEVNPNYSEAINNIGTVYYAQKKHKRAIEQYQKALKITPNSASIYSNLGTAYFARKNYKEAFEAYQKALSLDPEVFEHRSTQGVLLQERSVEERAKFHFFLAKTYAKAGMAERALLYMRKALEEGFKEREKFETDPDFARLKDLPEFQELLKLEPRVL